MKLCDLHTHLLPGVDDGASTMEYALQMLQNAVASDVKLLVATPHYNSDCEDFNMYRLQFQKLQQAAKDIPIQLSLGAEVLADPVMLQRLSQEALPTINGSRYMLTEFAPDTSPEGFSEMLQGILALGYIPLVAHPERYLAVNRMPQLVVPWLDMGCHLQLTGGSIMGDYGKTVQRTAAFLLQQDLVACIASDAHGLHRRSNFLLDVYDHLSVYYSKQYAQCLMYETPMAICSNADI
jgi:protein-tyrosine phosphatase